MVSVDSRLGAVLAAWVRLVTRKPWIVLVVATLLTVLVGRYTARNLGVDTNPAELFADDLPFRENLEAFEAAFPQFRDTLVLLLDGEESSEVTRAAAEVAQRLRADEVHFRTVYWPRGDPFFATHGLLYLSPEELRETLAPVVRMAPLFRYLEAEPTIGRLADALARAFTLAGARAPDQLLDIAAGLADAIDSARGSEPVSTLEWRDALGGGRAVSGGTRQIVVTQPVRDYTSFLPSGPAIEHCRSLARELGLAERGVTMRLTGDVALGHDELEQASEGAGMAGVLSLLLVSVFLGVGLRSVRLVIASLTTLLFGLVWTAGWAAWSVGHLNLISVAFAVLYISLGVDFSIHLCLRLRELRREGHTLESGLEAAARDVGGSLFLAALTTSLGFLAFVPTAFTGVAELGVIAGAGVLISLVANLTLLPALLCLPWLRPRTPAAQIHHVGAPGSTVLLPVRSHGRFTRHAALLLGAGAISALPWARFDANPLHLRDPDVESVRAFHDLASDPLTTPYVISVIAKDAQRAERVARSLEAVETVAGTTRLQDFVPAEQDEKLGTIDHARVALAEASEVSDRTVEDASPEEALVALRDALVSNVAVVPELERLRAAIEVLLGELDSAKPDRRGEVLARLDEAALGGLRPALRELRTALRADRVSVTDLPEGLRERFVTPDGGHRVEVRPIEELSIADELQRFARSVLAITPAATGAPIVVTESARIAVESFQTAFAYAFAAMAVALLLILRSAREVVLILIPLALAGLLTIAVMAVTGSPFNFANVIALPLLLGTGVDNGIHMVHRFLVDRVGRADLFRTSTVRAVLFSSLTTLGGFGTLVVSPHPGTASLGMLLCIGILANLLCTLVLLPVLLSGRAELESLTTDR